MFANHTHTKLIRWAEEKDVTPELTLVINAVAKLNDYYPTILFEPGKDQQEFSITLDYMSKGSRAFKLEKFGFVYKPDGFKSDELKGYNWYIWSNNEFFTGNNPEEALIKLLTFRAEKIKSDVFDTTNKMNEIFARFQR